MNSLRKTLAFLGRHPIASTFVMVVLVAAVLIFQFIRSRSDGILVDPISKGSIVESVYGIGTVLANRSYRIMPGVVGTITQMWVKEGDTVKKGDRLLGNESNVYRAPFDGTITSLPYKVGENVFASVPVCTIVDLTDRYLLLSMEQQGALRVSKGQKVLMSFDSIREHTYQGKVVAVYSNDVNYLARIDIGELPSQILPGMTADVAIEIAKRNDVLLIPVSALEKGKKVWRKRGNEIPKLISLQLGIVDKEMAEVTAGDLQPGDQLLIRKGSKK